ncbi:hypothetical protein [Pseudomonas sp. 31 E 6]|nr:hypothetical protein [Pseudomonas sp. 31 E 5]CRM20317.1 hypothetical protein [Pseudomonas sp. 31 E 6]CRM49561.1 hypothetical protein [Pseudomonas sp. 31 E 5]CRM57233.1 hypothetical protein [Pseudomonas sp. 31 E 6]CRM76270.1 hypothetical protein [Pseudomonas sp. 31 E 6]
MLFLLQHRVLPRPPAHLQRALLHPTDDPAHRHRFVAIHRLHELRKNRQHALNKTNGRLHNLRAVPGQPQAQIRHSRRRQCDGQHCANHKVNQQRHHKPSGHLRNLTGRQCVQPDHRCAHQQKQRRLVTGEQHRLFHDLGRVGGDLRQFGGLITELFDVFKRVFKNRLHPLDAVPHVHDRGPTARQHAAANRTRGGLFPIGLEGSPLLAKPLLQVRCQPGIGGKQCIDLFFRHAALHPHLIAPAGSAVVRALAVLIQHDWRGAAVIQPDHLDRNPANRHVIQRLEFALDLQLAARGAAGDGGKIRIGNTYRTLRVPDPHHPIHPQQGRYICGVAHRIQRPRIPGTHLLAINHQALMKAIQLMFDRGNVGGVCHP